MMAIIERKAGVGALAIALLLALPSAFAEQTYLLVNTSNEPMTFRGGDETHTENFLATVPPWTSFSVVTGKLFYLEVYGETSTNGNYVEDLDQLPASPCITLQAEDQGLLGILINVFVAPTHTEARGMRIMQLAVHFTVFAVTVASLVFASRLLWGFFKKLLGGSAMVN